MQALQTHFSVIRYDTRGHGKSPLPRGHFTIADLGQDVIDLLEHLQLDRASFCGLSMGGVIGQWLGIHAPRQIDRLVLANTSARIGSTEAWDTRIAAVTSNGFGSIIAPTLERWFTESFRKNYPEKVANVGALLRSANSKGYIACCAAIRDADFRFYVSEIFAPTKVIGGIYDPVIPPDESRYLAASISGATLAELNSAHLSNVEDADHFNNVLIGFLEK